MPQTEADGALSDARIDLALVHCVPATDRWLQYRKRRSPWRWFFLGVRDEPPVSTLNPIVEPDRDDPRYGICCSGGGVRSASFNLGALQAIQDAQLLQKTRFLAAVSGGSYIAAAFAMVAKTTSGPNEPPRDPPGEDSDPGLVTETSPPFYRGSPEEQYLRNRASYMAPTGMDKLYLLWRVVLGLVVNLLLIGAAVILIAALLCLYYRRAHEGLIGPTTGASPNGLIVEIGGGVAAIGVLLGLLALVLRPSDSDNAWVRGANDDVRRTFELWSLRIFVLGLVLLALEVALPELIDVMRQDQRAPGDVPATTLSAGVSASLAGIVATIVAQVRAQVADPAHAVRQATTWFQKLGPRIRWVFIYLATGLLGPFLILAMLAASTMFQLEATDETARRLIPGVAAAILAPMLLFGDLNTWSLHPFYRSRLSTAYALRRVERADGVPGGRAEARPEPELVCMSKTHVRPSDGWKSPDWPALLVCASANVSDPGAAPPGRGVTSFTFSATEMGGPLVGGIETAFFENKLRRSRRRDFTLPAVMAMSGAAIAPSMGKLTRPSIRFLMAMANVRLGVWLPNPRRIEAFVGMRKALRDELADDLLARLGLAVRGSPIGTESRLQALTKAKSKRALLPRPRPFYLIKELVGLNSINDKFLYVTDGGHYENLGLVELLRRGCRHIYCFDASGGRPLAQLGDAIALARSELGVEIEFRDAELDRVRENKRGIARRRCATGTITYTRSDPPVTGRIVYVPTVLTGDLPFDLTALKEKDPQFPHHSTLDQLFTDQKFEGYRTLGYRGAQDAMAAMGRG